MTTLHTPHGSGRGAESHSKKRRPQGAERVLRPTRAYSVGHYSSGRLLALAAVGPQDSTDPVERALRTSLHVNRPDIDQAELTAVSFDAASTERPYSLAVCDTITINKEHQTRMIMRGDYEAVLEQSQLSNEERAPLVQTVKTARRKGERLLGIATAHVDADGQPGPFRFQGVVGVKVEDKDRAMKDVRANPNQWVRVNLWTVPLRLQHWGNVALIVILSVTGYFIMNPGLLPAQQPGGDPGYLMGWVRFIHFVAAFLWLLLGFTRCVIWVTSRHRQLRWRAMWPIRSKRDLHGLVGTLKYYLFLQKHPPLYLTHNPLQQFAYTAIYLLCLFQMLSGLALYGLYNQNSIIWSFFSYPVHWTGIPTMRLIHAMIMFIVWMFVWIHVYLAVRADSVERHGGVSSMINGGVWLRRGAQPYDAPEIG